MSQPTPGTHVLTRYYCPYCGKQEMWQERGPGDFYVGPTTVCAACECETDRLDVWPEDAKSPAK